MTDLEIRAKALEIAVLILGPPNMGGLSGNADLILKNYRFLADAIEGHIRGPSQENPVKSAEN
jgi:hypothetical protein